MSACENIRSAHVETLKVEMFRMREGRKGERSEVSRPPIMNACLVYFDVP